MTVRTSLMCVVAAGMWSTRCSMAAELVYECRSDLGAQEVALLDGGRRLLTCAVRSNTVTVLEVDGTGITNRVRAIPIAHRFDGIAWIGFGPDGMLAVQEPWGRVTVLGLGVSNAFTTTTLSRQTRDWRVARTPSVVGDGFAETNRYLRALTLDSLHGKVVAFHANGFDDTALVLATGSELLNAGTDLYATQKRAEGGFALRRIKGDGGTDLSGILACKHRLLGTTVLTRVAGRWYCLWVDAEGVRASMYIERAGGWSPPCCLATFRDKARGTLTLTHQVHAGGITTAYCDNDRTIDVVDVGTGGARISWGSYRKPMSGMMSQVTMTPDSGGYRWMVLQDVRTDPDGEEGAWLSIWRLQNADTIARVRTVDISELFAGNRGREQGT